MTNLHNNFKGAPWYEESKDYTISVLGVGGIGSNTIYNLCKTLQSTIVGIDFDRVEVHNIGSQFFRKKDLGNFKVRATADILKEFLASSPNYMDIGADITTISNPTYYCTPILISAFDNMDARKKAFADWKTLANKELFIDGRLRATQYEVFCVTPELEERYEATLFNTGEVPPDPCTFKQTSYAGMMIGARITSFITNYLYNKSIGEEVCSVPFHYKELLELCHTEVIEISKTEEDGN